MCPITCPLVLDPSVASTAWSVFCTPSIENTATAEILRQIRSGVERLGRGLTVCRQETWWSIISVGCTMHILPKPSLRPTSLRLLHFPLVTFWIWYSSISLVVSLFAIFNCSGVFLKAMFLFDIMRLYWLCSMCLSDIQKTVVFSICI